MPAILDTTVQAHSDIPAAAWKEVYLLVNEQVEAMREEAFIQPTEEERVAFDHRRNRIRDLLRMIIHFRRNLRNRGNEESTAKPVLP